jgi:hypothetical protein
MIDNLINEIEQAMLNVLDNEQLSQLRKVLGCLFCNAFIIGVLTLPFFSCMKKTCDDCDGEGKKIKE